MNDMLRGRLLNWKFTQALAYLDGEPDDVRCLVEALARQVGDVGWFEGDLAIIIAAALRGIGVEEDSALPQNASAITWTAEVHIPSDMVPAVPVIETSPVATFTLPLPSAPGMGALDRWHRGDWVTVRTEGRTIVFHYDGEAWQDDREESTPGGQT